MKLTKILITAIAAASSVISYAQQAETDHNQSFEKGTNVINVGVGLGGQYNYFNSGYGETPNIVLSYENCTFPNVGPGNISLGGLLSYKGISYNYTYVNTPYTYSQAWTYYIIGLRSAYHYNFFNSPKCDPYAGVMLGYYYIGYKFTTDDPYAGLRGDPLYNVYSETYNSYWALSIYVGFRYYLSNSVGLWAELGYGYSTLAVGVNFKF